MNAKLQIMSKQQNSFKKIGEHKKQLTQRTQNADKQQTQNNNKDERQETAKQQSTTNTNRQAHDI